MAPPKTGRGGHDDAKPETPQTKEKNGHGASTNGKSRRVAHPNGASQQREPSVAAPPQPESPPTPVAPAPEPINPALQWTSFDRVILHAYRREYRLSTPTSFASPYHQWVLSQPGGIGLHSPTMARKKEFRRQSKDRLASAVRKHFNASGIQENDVIPDFLHKVRYQGSPRFGKPRRPDFGTPDHDR